MTTTLITGANKGLGKETARQLIAAGHTVWVSARDEGRGRATADELGARFVQLDVGATLGLHCCAPADGGAIMAAFPGALLALDMQVVTLDEAAVARHFAAGGTLVFGVFDTAAAELDRDRARNHARFVAASEKTAPAGIPVVMSGGCGTGLKSEAFDRTVNVTLGLPIIRTSPDHGTAFDIAGRGYARPDSLIAALRLADDIAQRRSA